MESGEETALMEACNLVSETVPHRGLHLQVMVDGLEKIEQLQGGEVYDEEEFRFTEDNPRFSHSEEMHDRSSLPPPPSITPPPPPSAAEEPPSPPQRRMPVRVIERRVSQQEIKLAEGLQYHMEQCTKLPNLSKDFRKTHCCR